MASRDWASSWSGAVLAWRAGQQAAHTSTTSNASSLLIVYGGASQVKSSQMQHPTEPPRLAHGKKSATLTPAASC